MVNDPHTACASARRGRRVWGAAAALLLGVGLVIGVAGRLHADDPETVKAYQRQFEALAADDVDGHVKLALWCRDQQAWDLLLQQSNHILTISPDNSMARMLLELAKSKRKGSSGEQTPTGDAATDQTQSPQGPPGMVSDAQVQIIRRKTLKLNMRENVQVTFRNDVEERFWAYAAERERWSKDAQTDYRRLRNVEKAQFILGRIHEYEAQAYETPFADTFSQDIFIRRDPAVMASFRREVWPIIEMGCATSGCHTGADAPAPSFRTGRRLTDNMLYTNFLVLTEYQQNLDWLVDRGQPLRSLLLLYAVSPKRVRPGEPTHPTEIKPLCVEDNNEKCETLFKWIQFLGDDQPDYGFTVKDLGK